MCIYPHYPPTYGAPKPSPLERAGLPIDHCHTTLKYQALHAAVEFGHLDAARLLVCMGAKVGVNRSLLSTVKNEVHLLQSIFARARRMFLSVVTPLVHPGAPCSQVQKALHNLNALHNLKGVVDCVGSNDRGHHSSRQNWRKESSPFALSQFCDRKLQAAGSFAAKGNKHAP